MSSTGSKILPVTVVNWTSATNAHRTATKSASWREVWSRKRTPPRLALAIPRSKRHTLRQIRGGNGGDVGAVKKMRRNAAVRLSCCCFFPCCSSCLLGISHTRPGVRPAKEGEQRERSCAERDPDRHPPRRSARGDYPGRYVELRQGLAARSRQGGPMVSQAGRAGRRRRGGCAGD